VASQSGNAPTATADGTCQPLETPGAMNQLADITSSTGRLIQAGPEAREACARGALWTPIRFSPRVALLELSAEASSASTSFESLPSTARAAVPAEANGGIYDD
jgi:hypothetical protein